VRNHRVSEWCRWLEAAGLRAEPGGDFPMRLEFASWFERMQTPETQAAAVRALFEGASDAARETFVYRPAEGTWTIPIALVRGTAAP
jgi:hypothetical protein